MQLNQRDLQLLALLQQDCRIANAELAEQVGMSASACWRRIKAFEKANIITRYSAVLNEANMGLGFRAITHVQMSRHNPEDSKPFVQAIMNRKEVIECYATTGREDFSLHLVCKDISAYNDFLENFLFRISGVKSAYTNVILRDIKRPSFKQLT